MIKTMLNLFRKVKWFFINYKQISFTLKLVPTDHLSIPGRNFHGPLTYNTDGLATSNNCDFINDPRFIKAYRAAAATNPWPNFTLQWRVYIVCWFAEMVKNLEGDFVECGVNTGAYAISIINYIEFEKLEKKFYLLDTFKGLDPQQISDEEKKAGIESYLKGYRDVFAEVQQTFAPYKSVQLIRGLVPDTLPECNSTKICYLSLDMNVVMPEIAAINYFWDKIVVGGVLLLDDYGFPQHIHQKDAFDVFAKEKGVQILCLPTGQGVIIKSK